MDALGSDQSRNAVPHLLRANHRTPVSDFDATRVSARRKVPILHRRRTPARELPASRGSLAAPRAELAGFSGSSNSSTSPGSPFPCCDRPGPSSACVPINLSTRFPIPVRRITANLVQKALRVKTYVRKLSSRGSACSNRCGCWREGMIRRGRFLTSLSRAS